MMGFLGSAWFLVVTVIGSIILSVAGLFLVRKLVDRQKLEAHHTVAASFLSIVGTLYAVVLGFIVVDALNTFDKARVMVEQEANSLHDVFHMSAGLPLDDSNKIRRLCYEYASEMVNGEWKTMEQGGPSPKAHEYMQELWHSVIRFQPKTSQEQDLHSALIDEMKDVGDARHSRLLAAAPAYDPVIWAVLITGSVVTIIFTYFFGFESLNLQIIMTAMVSIVLSLNLILVAMFGYPFSGDVKVAPTPFQADRDYFASEMRENK